MVENGKLCGEFRPHLCSLQGTPGGKDGDLRHGARNIHLPRVSEEIGRGVEVVPDLLLDQRHVGLQRRLSEAILDEFLLLDELGIGTIVDHIRPEHWSGQGAVHLLRVHVFQLAIENELVALHAQVDGGVASQKHKGEDVAVLDQSRCFQLAISSHCRNTEWRMSCLLAYLLETGEEKLVRVDPIADCTAQKRDPVEDQRRPSLIHEAKEQLIDKVECDGCYKSQQPVGSNSRPGHGERLEASWIIIITMRK